MSYSLLQCCCLEPTSYGFTLFVCNSRLEHSFLQVCPQFFPHRASLPVRLSACLSIIRSNFHLWLICRPGSLSSSIRTSVYLSCQTDSRLQRQEISSDNPKNQPDVCCGLLHFNLDYLIWHLQKNAVIPCFWLHVCTSLDLDSAILQYMCIHLRLGVFWGVCVCVFPCKKEAEHFSISLNSLISS